MKQRRVPKKSDPGSKKVRLALPVVLLVLAFAMPPEASLNAGALRLSAYRIVLLVMIGPCIYRMAMGRAGKWLLPDSLIVCHGAWSLLALIVYAGLGQGIESGGIYMVEAVGAYLVARCFLRNAQDFAKLVQLMMLVVTVMMMFAAVESVTGNHFLRETSRRVLGGPPLIPIEPRLGLHRAYASFDHPILYGIFCAGAFGFSAYVGSAKRGLGRRLLRPALAICATFFSLSSGAFSALGVQLFLVMWDRATRQITYRWYFLLGIIFTIWTAITLMSNRGPVKVFLSYMTFSPGTGYNRLRIWEYGSAEVQRHPVFGIGLGEWERPSWMVSGSMDNFWLATAVRYGLPAFLALAAAVFLVGYQQTRLQALSKEQAACRIAWLISIIGLSMAGCTVHFWNALFCLFCFLVGAGVWLIEPHSQRDAKAGHAFKFQNDTAVSFRNKHLAYRRSLSA